MKSGNVKMNLVFGAVMYFVANNALLRPVSAGISMPDKFKNMKTIETSKTEIGLTRKQVRSERRSMAALDPESRRRRRSAQEAEFLAFRQFVHSLRRRRGGLDIDDEDIVRRDTAITVMERGSVGRTIASKVNCGECKLTKQWIPVNKKGCRTNYVLAPTCMGMCETWEIPSIHPPYVTTNHRVCRPKAIEYRMIRLRKCNPGVDNTYIVPMAKSCICSKCKSKNTACRPLL